MPKRGMSTPRANVRRGKETERSRNTRCELRVHSISIVILHESARNAYCHFRGQCIAHSCCSGCSERKGVLVERHPFAPLCFSFPSSDCLTSWYQQLQIQTSSKMDLSQLLSGSLSHDPTIRREAERALEQMQRQPGFGLLPLQLTGSAGVDRSVKQAAALLYKNYVKANWKAASALPRVC